MRVRFNTLVQLLWRIGALRHHGTTSYPSYFKLHARWLYLLTPVAYATGVSK
ncbi:hypothetical protein [Klebsiella variicola]|uniref:hypothetical protein n=1 Tax=Klebsiella variicola TaxID=244366 RepID=UPI0015C5893D|nr:hypothetical protein [Klebsiella variicola]